ncbi:hypothetical protein [Kerstersia gyiorum]|uniref:hypothetical protein n=1 Tax=Kerstersia gyiorum TaxID=206506 RepID=UPI00209F88EE|nr:hypothetical protein [Kerstersia gyiorum]MCP1636961.1 hypothetical protein [Kerstersia gyiorum]MCP1670438.1 hypothetical protein [Kerstersia gyiorum]MCP1678909.1 hypothetical protein [Kerstersia gyiorum]MCP1708346.1 hypothetical protein [Kerstersia gyiorum]MCP1712360.1 hypothetical protein [Kerstersia gyiorum]
MSQTDKDNQIKPFFITEEVEAEMVSRGYSFDPPSHAREISLPKILAGLSDDALARWEGDFADEEREKRLMEKSINSITP